MKVGLRVIPNKNVNWCEDCCYMGTLTQTEFINENYVVVKWDKGHQNTHGIGGDKGYGLLVFDSAQIGIKHDNCLCKGCNNQIYGTKWKCIECDYCVCTECYMSDFHKDHSFYRKDSPDEIGVFVGKRNQLSLEKYYGIVSQSFVQTASQMSKLEHGVVDSFGDRPNSYRSIVKVKMESNKIVVKKLGYQGDVDISLDNNKEKTKKDIYANHLRILNLHPIINRDFFHIYRIDFQHILFREMEEQIDFQKDDVVYVECFDVETLKLYQNSFGESNNKVEKLIGRSGTVNHVESYRVQVYFSEMNESFNFNYKILFNSRNSEMKIVKICDAKKLITEIENWRNCQKFEKLPYKNWIPEQNILDMICNKIGVIISDTLPDNLVVIRFKLFPHCFCMILPSSVYLNIEQCEDDIDLVEIISCSLDFENKDMEVGENLIKSEDLITFLEWLKNPVVSKNDWYNLMMTAIEKKNITIIEGLLNKPITGVSGTKDILLWNICCLKYERKISITPEIHKMLINSINLLNIPKNIVGNNNLLHLSSKNNDSDIVELLLNKNPQMVNSQDNLGCTALHYAAENDCVPVVKILMKNNCNIYIIDKIEKYTALHLALKNHSIESFSCILEMYHEDLNFTGNEKSILCMSASYPSDGNFSKWKKVINNGDASLINEIIEKFKDFQSKPNIKNLENVALERIPCAVLSCMILSKGKDAYQTWISKDGTNKSPEERFVETCKKLETSFHINSFKLFYHFINEKNQKYDICKFCNGNYATIIYKPCGHQIHCEFCAFMPFKCSTCNEDIKEKISAIDNKELNSFEIWADLSKKVKGVSIKNMQDWYDFIEKTIKSSECRCCCNQKWNVVIECGHVLCKSCFDKIKKCMYTCNKENPISIQVKDL